MEMKGKQTWSFAEGKGWKERCQIIHSSLGGGNRSLYFCHYSLYFNIFLIFYTKHSFCCAKLLCMKLCVGTSVVSLVAEGRGRAEEPHPLSGFLIRFHLVSGSGEG